jgi:kynureninase
VPRRLSAPRTTSGSLIREPAASAIAEFDRADPLADFVDRFTMPDEEPSLIYFDGNSLGPQPLETAAALAAELERWRTRLIRGWNERWLTLGEQASATITQLIGAAPGTVRVADSTTVCLYKLSRAALADTGRRPDVVSDKGNFPTDLYVLDAAATQAGGRLRLLDATPACADIVGALDDRVGLVALSHVDFRTGALLDLHEITAAAHDAGALVLWDLSHSAGVVPVDVGDAGVDLAVGCTYKYLNGGPGAPAYLYVRPDLVDRLASPIPGWFGHASPFAMDTAYRPAEGIDRFLAGTPAVLALAAVQPGLDLVSEAGITAIRAKSMALTSLAIDLADAWLAPFGVEVVTPRDAGRRGSHIALRHPQARRITAMLTDANVIGDFRSPDIIRIGLSPLSLRFADVHQGFTRFADGMAQRTYTRYSADLGRVT